MTYHENNHNNGWGGFRIYICMCANSSQHHARDFAIIQIMPKNNLTMNLKCTFSIILAE